MISNATAPGRIMIPMLLALFATACGGPELASMEVDRVGWDTLRVSIRFAESGPLGRSRPVRPLAVSMVLFDARYDTLYAGSDSVIAVPDARLQDAEPLLLEGCGHFEARPVCEQRTVFASPKRIRSRPRIEYPEDEGFTKGSFDVTPVAERQRFGGIEWEPIEVGRLPGLTALVSVERGEGRPLRIPMPRQEGKFDLTRLDGYRDFRFDLRSAFRDSGEARVRFDVVAEYSKVESPAGSSVLTVRSRTEEEVMEELSVLVEAAGRQLVDRLFEPADAGRTVVFVNDWDFDPEKGRYVTEIEVHRRYGIFARWSEAVGILSVSDDGDRPVYRLVRSNREIRERWDEVSQGDSLSLLTLPDPRPARPSRTRLED